jgi:hypothetical protein
MERDILIALVSYLAGAVTVYFLYPKIVAQIKRTVAELAKS